MERLDSFEWKNEELLFRWLCGIARNIALNAGTKEQRRKLAAPPSPGRHSVTPSVLLRREERYSRLKEAFRRLPADQRRILHLARIEGLGFREIAARLGRSPAAVRQAASRAARRLRETFGETESFSLPARPLEFEFDKTRPGPAER
jgi:RNA polymerase sigma factor (sigma-70 family)